MMGEVLISGDPKILESVANFDFNITSTRHVKHFNVANLQIIIDNLILL